MVPVPPISMRRSDETPLKGTFNYPHPNPALSSTPFEIEISTRGAMDSGSNFEMLLFIWTDAIGVNLPPVNLSRLAPGPQLLSLL